MKVTFIISFLIAFYSYAWPPGVESFLREAAQNWSRLISQPIGFSPEIVAGQKAFVPLSSLVRGQDEISIDNMNAKLEEKKSLGDIAWNEATGKWEMAFDRGRSSVSLADPVQVIKGPMGYVITDGHHDVFLALYFGADSIAVEVKEDLSKLSAKDFWQNMKSRNLVYLRQSPEVLATHPPQMMQVRDNPNRYLAALIAVKVKTLADGRVTVKGSKVPVWGKVNESLPFIEFYIAQALTEGGIRYQSEWGTDIPTDIIEKCREVLIEKAASVRYPMLKQIPILPSAEIASRARGDYTIIINILNQQNKPIIRTCKTLFR